MIKMENKDWNQKVKNNFNDSAYRYLEYSNIQKFFATKIVNFIKELNVKKKGEWIDLGSGPGLLADEIEKEFSSQKVCRIDFSKKMLLENKLSSKKILWDLNNYLPSEINNCSLIASNFCIHWLNNPEKIIKNWFSKLMSGGFLIISYPTKDCFPEWKDTCKKINIEYSGLNFLCSKELLKNFKPTEIYHSETFNYLENFEDVYKLFRSLINVGAQSTNCKRKTVKELKEIQKFWPKNYNNTVNLSWQIEIQIIKKS
jgi:malonyl-CoA O-methyltransferase